MHTSFLLLFLSFSVLAQPNARIEVLSNPQTLEDFDHQFKGCPENSECDQVMGLQLSRWKDLINKIKDDKMNASKKASFTELFREKYGVPVEFYTYQKSQQGFKPLLLDSHCREHASKDKEKKILKGSAFIKSLSATKAVVWRDQTQIEVPVGELIVPQDVKVYYPEEKTYQLPIGDQPLFIKNKELYVVKEEDGFFYMLKVSENGDWKIVDMDFSNLTSFEEKRQEVTCLPDQKKAPSKYFAVEFCKTVWDHDLKKTVIVKMRQGCVL